VNSKLVLITTAVLIGIFGLGWLIMPDMMGNYWKIDPGDNLNYMGRRYAAFMLGLVVALWLARNALQANMTRSSQLFRLRQRNFCKGIAPFAQALMLRTSPDRFEHCPRAPAGCGFDCLEPT
jgi:hypothetical protein